MTAAIGALDLDPVAVWVGEMLYRAFNLFVEGWPAAMGVELVGRPVELGIALAADIGTGLVEVVIFPGKGPFGPLVLDDVFFFGG